MEIEEYLQSIGVSNSGEYTDRETYSISLGSSNEFGKMFSKLEKEDDLIPMEDNQVVTEQGSSLLYQSETHPILLNLIADFDGDVYQLVANYIGE